MGDFLRIEISQDDIENGEKGRSHCPVALAVRRAVEKLMGYSVDGITIVDDPYNPYKGFKVLASDVVIGPYIMGVGAIGSKTWWPLPKEVREFIRCFDEGLDVKPLNFTLRLSGGERSWPLAVGSL